MQIVIEVMAERSEGVATNLTDKEFIEMLKLICKRYEYEIANNRIEICCDTPTYSNLIVLRWVFITTFFFFRQNIDKKKVADAEEYFRKTGKRQSGILTFENLSAHDSPELDPAE